MHVRRQAAVFCMLFLIPLGVAGAVKILPFGDSITDGSFGNVYPGAYRVKLWELLFNAGWDVDFVGSLQNGPSSLPDKDHEGIIGMWSDCCHLATSDYQEHLDTKLNTYQPDIVLLMLGANDVIHGTDSAIAKVPENIAMLIDTIDALVPAALVIVSTLTPNSWNGQHSIDATNAINSELPGVVAGKVDEGKQVWLVDMADLLLPTDLADNVHPNQQGYEKIAGKWFEALITATTQSTRGQPQVVRGQHRVATHSTTCPLFSPQAVPWPSSLLLNGRATLNPNAATAAPLIRFSR